MSRTCPDCGSGPLRRAEGCETCLACGWSACLVADGGTVTDAEKWAQAADWEDDEVDLDGSLETLEWEHTTDRTPYDNLVALVEALPNVVEDATLRSIAFRRITGLGPGSAQRALENYHDGGGSA